MSLDVTLTVVKPTEVFSSNITHNLISMAKEAGLYTHLWRPEELGLLSARELIEPLRIGLSLMKQDPDRFRKHNPHNGYGCYENLVSFVEKYLAACENNPDAIICISR